MSSEISSDSQSNPPKKTFQDLCKLAAILRSEKGCPWDRKQTLESMIEHLEEEVGEIKEAIHKKDHPNLAEEIGDTLFQLIMITQIAKEKGEFNMDDVIKKIDHKIVSRHTWVFGDDQAVSAEEALKLWQKNKAKEKS